MKKKYIKWAVIVTVGGLVIGSGTLFYMFNMPHRDVQSTDTDYKAEATEIVQEYLTDAAKANEKYLDEEGESKVFEVTGTLSSINDDYNNNKVALLKGPEDEAGVSCTFTKETNSQVESLTLGSKITVKGVIRAGAAYDEDLEMYENVILEKCALIK